MQKNVYVSKKTIKKHFNYIKSSIISTQSLYNTIIMKKISLMVNNNFEQHTVLGADLWVASTHFVVI